MILHVPGNSRDGNPLVRTYVLPDFLPDSTNKLGYVRSGLTPPPPSPPPVDPSAPYNAPQQDKDEEQLLYLCNERFSVPEVLFNPSTIGEYSRRPDRPNRRCCDPLGA
jgi:actin-related protein 6